MEKPKQCPECERDAKVRCTMSTRWYWVECPKCGRQTQTYRNRSDAVDAWNDGNTYMPEREPDKLPDEYEEIRKQSVIRRW